MSFGKQFLEYPDLFPARASGEPAGDREIVFDCAGGPYRLSGLSPAQEEAIQGRFTEFCRSGSDGPEPAVQLRVFQTTSADFTGIPFPDREYTFESDYEPHSVRLAGRYFMARLDWRPELSAAVWTPHDREFVSYGDFENLFRVLIAQRLLERGGLLLHSSGVVIDGGAHIFFGYSGAGKTTVAKLGLEHGYQVLSDDIDLLAPANDGLRAARSPFAGVMGRTPVSDDSYPVRGIYKIEQGQGNAIRSMTRAEAVCALLARSPFVNQDPHRADRLVENLSSLTEAVPASVLTFDKTGGFWDLLHSGNAAV